MLQLLVTIVYLFTYIIKQQFLLFFFKLYIVEAVIKTSWLQCLQFNLYFFFEASHKQTVHGNLWPISYHDIEILKFILVPLHYPLMLQLFEFYLIIDEGRFLKPILLQTHLVVVFYPPLEPSHHLSFKVQDTQYSPINILALLGISRYCSALEIPS